MVEREVELPTRADTAADILDLTLATMPARRREVFQLIREDGFSYEETAEQLGLSLGTICTHDPLATGRSGRRSAGPASASRIGRRPARPRAKEAPHCDRRKARESPCGPFGPSGPSGPHRS